MRQSEFNSETLKLVRNYYGLSQSAFAKKLNMTQSKLSQLENGEKEIDETLLSYMKEDFKENFFLNQFIIPSQQLYYRKLASTSKGVVSKFEARLTIVSGVIKKLLDDIEIPQNNILSIDVEEFNFDFEYIAEQVRLKIGHLRGSINDIVKLLEKNGVIIHFFEYDFIQESSNKFDGVSTYVDGVPIIFINNKIPNSRKVFTIAHELGHLVMHFDYIINPDRNIENEANKFASAFLAPKNEVKSEFKGFKLEKLFQLKSEWKMSAAAILYRAKEIGNINEDWYKKCMLWISKYRKKEPYEFELSSPILLKRMIEMSTNENNFSFLNNIGIDESVKEQLFGAIIEKKESKLKLVVNNL
ncbi:ImmA/IrrE family metallo-endopeptidase [Bergeyella porcorum]|uniref:ImmA/IrrE family metallo-endopeptidase n=1 Tax=Bergeyella porcorum TaxID=1735111 RepID=UPI0035E9AD9F